MQKGRRFTKDEIRKVMTLWESKTVQDIAEELDRSAPTIQYVAKHIRLAGHDLPKKSRVGHLDGLIKEVISEGGNY